MMDNKENNKNNDREEVQIDCSFTAAKTVFSVESNHTVNSNITQVYERKNYDDPYARKKFSEKEFADKKTTVDATGNTVHSSHKAARNKYKSNAPLHQAETDHIDPLKDIQSRHKANAYLSDADIKEVANRDKNFQHLNKSDNASKGAKSEIKVGIEEGDINRVAKGIKAKTETEILLAEKTAKNIYVQAKAVAPQAASTALVTTVYDAANLLPDLLSGKITKEEYVKQIADTGGKTFLVAEGTGIVLPQINHMLSNSSVQIFKSVGDSGYIGAVISTGMIIANSSVRLANGEITVEQYAKEIATGGLGMASNFIICSSLGPIAGPVASIALSMVCASVQNAIKSINEEHQRRMEMLNVVANYIEGELKNQSEKLDVIFAEVKNEWDSNMTLAFKNINKGILNDDPKTINDGIDMILNEMNVKTKFNSASDFRAFLDSSDRVLTI